MDKGEGIPYEKREKYQKGEEEEKTLLLLFSRKGNPYSHTGTTVR